MFENKILPPFLNNFKEIFQITKMRTVFFLSIAFFLFCQCAQKPLQKIEPKSRVVSIVDSTHLNNMVLTQIFEINVSRDKVWEAFTTKEGWESWSVPIAEIDFKIGGLIQTNYDKTAQIGDKGTIRLHIINYVPNTMLTLQAELTENFPEFMKEDSKELFNVVYFEELSSNKTKVISYGIGYKKTKKYLDLLKFFIAGNASSYEQLISYLETGNPIKF